MSGHWGDCAAKLFSQHGHKFSDDPIMASDPARRSSAHWGNIPHNVEPKCRRRDRRRTWPFAGMRYRRAPCPAAGGAACATGSPRRCRGFQQSRQFVAGVRSLADERIELGGGDAKLLRNARKVAAIYFAKLADFLPLLEPIAEQIDGAFDDRVCFDLGCHGALRWWLNWPSMLVRERRVVAMDQTG